MSYKDAAGGGFKPSSEETPSSGDNGPGIGERLRFLLRREGRSLDSLAATSGLTKKKLNEIATDKVVPPLNLLWKIANTLGVPFGSLTAPRTRTESVVLRRDAKQVIASSDGGLTSRALLPHDSQRLVEFYELTIAPGHIAYSEAHGAETLESLVVVRGRVEITAGKGSPQSLEEGDAFVFQGDVPHSYRNLAETEALLYLVMSYVNLSDPIKSDVSHR